MTGSLRMVSRLGGALLLSLGSAVVSTPIVSAAPPTSGPAASLPVRSCPSGIKLNLPTSSSIDADGWTRMDYDVKGVHSYTEIPPAGFDVPTASPDLLARHHIELPSRTETGATLDQWNADMGKLQWNRTQGACGPLPFQAGTHQLNARWGGDAVLLNGYTFQGVKAYQKQTPLSSYCGSMSSLGSWVGLGGAWSGIAFLQTGTWVKGSGWPGGSGYGSFWEYFNSSGVGNDPQDLGVPVAANDSIFEYVTQISAYTGFVEVYNATKLTVGTQYVTLSGASGLGSTAEWIDERLEGSGLAGTLNRFSGDWTSWTSMSVLRSNSTTWTGAYSEPNEWWYDMYRSNYLSKTTGSYSDNHMKDHWYACS
jgi:Peptidase A4 family